VSRNFIESLIAVVGGNAVYFLLLPELPERARHVPYSFDVGLVVDFWFCVVMLGLVRTLSRRIFRT